MKFSRVGIIKFVFISLLTIGGVGFVISLPNIIVNWLIEKAKPKHDDEGNMIYEDGRHTIASFGKRKEFDVWKSRANGSLELFLYDRDNNKEIDKVRFFTQSSSTPHVYTLGEKGYTKLNYETAEIKQSKNMKDFSEEDQLVFKRLEVAKAEEENEQEKYEINWDWIISNY